MIKCPKCLSRNPDGSVYCNICGFKLENGRAKKILLVESIAASNFFLTKTFKKNGFDVKSLRSPNFVIDELSNNDYYACIMDMDLSNGSNLNFLKTLKKLYPKQNTIIITPFAETEGLHLLKSIGITTVLIKPVKVESILSHLGKNKNTEAEKSDFKYPVCGADNLEQAVLPYIKDNDITYLIVFLIKDLSKENITSKKVKTLLDKVFNSIKRSDVLIIVEGAGFVLIPKEHITDKGADILKNRIKSFIDENMLISSKTIKYPYGRANLSEVCSMAVTGSFKQTEDGSSEQQSKEANNTRQLGKDDVARQIKKYDLKQQPENNGFEQQPKKKSVARELQEEKKTKNKTQLTDIFVEEELLKNKHLIFSALSHLKDDDVACLYFNKKLKKFVAPYITVSQARIINRIKKDQTIDDGASKFIEMLKEIADMNNACKNDGVEEQIESNISLMTLPEIQSNIIMLINEEASFKRIVAELQKDAAISGKVLKLVNSAFFGFSRQIKNLERAAAILGTEEILGLSLSISYINSFNKNISFIKELWKENIAIMSIIKFIENEYKLYTSSTTPSILSNIGKIFFAQYFPKQYINAVKEARETGRIYDAVELKYFSSPHTVVGARIAEMWNLPNKIKVSALYHAYPSAYSKLNTSLHLIHAAKYIAGVLGYTTTPQTWENMGYYTYTMLLKKHSVDVKKAYEEKGEEIKRYIEDMMFLMS